MNTYRPTWLEIDLDAIRSNFLKIKRIVGRDVKVLVAVKADAYGHGMIEAAKVLASCGVDYFGVGSVDEAVRLKKRRLGVPVLNLLPILKDQIPAVLKYRIAQGVGDLQLAKSLNSEAKKRHVKARVHLKIDTGMGRLGVWHDEAMYFIRDVLAMRNLIVEGVYTHFSSADEDFTLTNKQIDNFLKLINEIEQLNINIKYIHSANSAAVVYHKSSHFNLIRPGLMIYGLYPSKSIKRKIDLNPVLSLKSRVSFIKKVPPGSSISYGATYITKRHTRIAIIPIGYADGYNRLLSNKGAVLIRGKKCRVLGRVCMDQIIVDIGHINNTKIGDEVVLIGRQGKEQITVEQIAGICRTIPYEVPCWLSPRIRKVYV